MKSSKKPLLNQTPGEALSSNTSAETNQPLQDFRPLTYMIEFDPDVQTERSPDDALAAMVLEAAYGFDRDANDVTNFGSIFINESQRWAWATALSRLDDAHSLVIAWNGSDAPLLCPRAAHALSRFRMALESLGYEVRGFAASVHDNLGMPSFHGMSWAMVIAGASFKIVQELMDRTWRDASEAVRPHRCCWCRFDSEA